MTSWADDSQQARKDADLFERHIRPLLADKCWDCHGAETQENGLRLDDLAHLLKGGKSGKPTLVPGDVSNSEMIRRIQANNDDRMPPEDRLTKAQITLLKEWVKSGAKWPKAGMSVGAIRSWATEFAEVREKHWALQPIKSPPIPTVHDSDWVRNPLDALILAQLKDKGLTPSPPADRRTWIRRVTLDLWGIPPTPQEVQEFLEDHRPGADERLVDRLLASPKYGERWGRYWLDVARYADTKGYAFDRERRYPYAYTYRDYVIDAHNRDLRFDQFVLEQLAADLLPGSDDAQTLAALGFLTVGRKYNNRHEDIDDQIDVLSRGLLGLTVSCARCHDHKYDPIPDEDYYSLYGVFASCIEPTSLPLLSNPEQTIGYADYKAELDKRRVALDKLVEEKRGEIIDQARRRIGDYLAQVANPRKDSLLDKQLAEFSLSADDLRPKLIIGWRQYLLKESKPDHPVWGPLFQVVKAPNESWESAKSALASVWSQLPEGTKSGQINPLLKQRLLETPPSSKVDVIRRYGELFVAIYLHEKEPGKSLEGVKASDASFIQLQAILMDQGTPTNIPKDQIRGYLNRKDNNEYRSLEKAIEQWQVDSPGSPARAMVVEELPKPIDPRVFVRGNPARPGKHVPRRFLGMVVGADRKDYQQGSGRLELAHAIASEDNPLTARVFVQRVWMRHFGKPMVSTPSDFGVRTPRPVQHAALDYLASEFIHSGWSTKSLHRVIVLSSTYRQASLDRVECRRLDPENTLLWKMNRHRLSWEALRDSLLFVSGNLDLRIGGRSVDITKKPYAKRRTVYAFIDRQDLPSLFRIFNLANPDQSSGKRPQTTVPQQALFLLNSPFVWEQSKSLAGRMTAVQTDSTEDRLNRLYQLALGRDPDPKERDTCLEYIQSAPKAHQARVWTELAQVLLCSNEFAYVD